MREAYTLKEKNRGSLDAVFATVWKAAGAAGIITGLTGIISALGGVPVLIAPLLCGFISAFVIFGVEYAANGRPYGIFLCLLSAAAIFFGTAGTTLQGIFLWINQFRGRWNTIFETYYGELLTAGAGERELLAAGLVFSLLGGAVICELVQKKRLVLLTVVSFAPLCLALMLSVRLLAWMPACLAGGWMAVWCMGSGDSRITLQRVFLTVCVGGALCVIPAENAENSWQKFSSVLRKDIKQGIGELRYGKDSLPQGDLRQAGRMLEGSEERLEIQTETANPIYLRGFIGSEYDGSLWKQFSGESYGGEYSGMLSWLERQGFYPGMQYAEYQNAVLGDRKEQLKASVSVKNIGADRRYVYLPETAEAYSPDKGEWKQDWFLKSEGLFGQKSYEFTYYNTQVGAELELPDVRGHETNAESREEEAFLQAERVYRSFVYENYLELEEEQKELIDRVFFQGDTWQDTGGIYTVTSRIRMVLRVLAAYKERPAQVPAGRDFAAWFLEEGQEGNAAYYASAAVLAYRSAGIPARYAEGYVLTKEQAEKVQGETVILTEKNAHAWVEIYMDSMGWRPVEVTPGFYEEPYQADVVVAVPNEALTGTNGEAAAVPSSEEYDFPEEKETVSGREQKRKSEIAVLILAVLSVAVLMEIIRLARYFYQNIRYHRLTSEEKMCFIFDRVMDMMEEIYQDFNPEQPLRLPAQACGDFDEGLYVRTINRIEKILYGQSGPAEREIPAAEALERQVRKSLSRKAGWRKRLKWRYGKGYFL